MPSDFPHIRYLCLVREVYRLRRIGAAAEVVHLSQPAATQALARVEEMLGVDLFERRPKGMIPTETGHLFERRLLRMLEHLRAGDSLARKKAARRDGSNAQRGEFFRFCSPVQLRALLAVWKSGSFNQAAQELGVSQPAVHRATRELGSLSGLTLFDQTRGGVVLTPAAEAFAHQVLLAQSEFRQAAYEINEFLGRDVTRINLGSMPLSRSSIVPAAIDTLLQEVGPGVQVNCVDARYHALLRDLRFGDLDVLIGALRHPNPAEDVEQEPLFEDQLAVVASPGHPLTGATGLTLEDTLVYPWIAPPMDTPSGSYLFETMRIQDRPDTPVRIVSSSLILLRGLLARGNYISIASKRQIEVDVRLGSLAVLPIDLPDSGRMIGLTIRAGWSPTPVQKRFLDILRYEARKEVPELTAE
ncbi:LysR family transcriptional regulator [Thalassovita sp.]|uniref:LysR family transcriptional regulator n=1 Tax=Thalassovita sp. TaxID=1979401 RepID=UPI0029DE76F0|nr:LysR family transcriptional regulator [Thalassovita sp.]